MINLEAGQYLKQENHKKKNELLIDVSYIFLFIGFLMGFVLSYYVSQNKMYYVFIVILINILLVYIAIKFKKKGENINNRIDANNKGISGEKKVAYQLDLLRSKFSNFYVINCYQTNKFGDIDHIVISQKGIFAIETKNYKNISYDDKDKHAKQIRGRGVYLKELLEKDFGIDYVQPVLIYIGHSNIKSIKNEKIISEKEIEITINNNKKIVKKEKLESIYKFLNEKQQGILD